MVNEVDEKLQGLQYCIPKMLQETFFSIDSYELMVVQKYQYWKWNWHLEKICKCGVMLVTSTTSLTLMPDS